MKQQILNGFFQVGAIMALIGAASYITGWNLSSYLYLIGAVMLLVSQILTPFHTDNHVIRRLHVQQIMGGFFLFASAICMFVLRGNEWIVLLAISCVFILYSTFRISYEMKKEQNSHE